MGQQTEVLTHAEIWLTKKINKQKNNNPNVGFCSKSKIILILLMDILSAGLDTAGYCMF